MTASEHELIKFIDQQAKQLIGITPNSDKYSQFIESKLSEYLANLKALNTSLKLIDVDFVLKTIKDNNDLIFNIIHKYEDGDVFTANDMFIENFMFRPSINPLFKKHAIKNIDIETKFYRARTSDSNANMEQKMMFHIPFDKRRLVNNFRFSINGYPCLYLCNCAYLCWEELNRPNLDEICISKFQYVTKKNKLRVVTLNPSIFNEDNILVRLSTFTGPPILWLIFLIKKIPLYFILLNKVKDKSAVFKPEYLFPQMFTNFVRKHLIRESVVGIEYPSTKISDETFSFFNYTFFSYPMKSISNYCDFLSETFHFTEGFPLIYSGIVDASSSSPYDPTFKNIPLNLGKNLSIQYASTLFYKHESLLDSIPVSKLC